MWVAGRCSSCSESYARLLAAIFPEQEAALTDLGRQIGYGRVIAGVHYPIDVLAGQKLGDACADAILKQKTFQEAVARIRGRGRRPGDLRVPAK